MNRPTLVLTALIAGVRLTVFSIGAVLMTQFGDWRQVVGDPMVLLSAFPDALVVRWIVSPRSGMWPFAMAASILITSSLLAVVIGRRRRSS